MRSHFVNFISRARFVCGVLLIFTATRATAQEQVGAWGDPARIVIEGAKHWPAEEIRKAIIGDVPSAVAGHPSAPLADYPTVLAIRLRDGYLEHGFALAKTTARIDARAKKIVLTVDEGPRYIAGKIEVSGAKAINTAQLIDWLTHRQPEQGAHQGGFKHEDGKAVPNWVDKKGEAAALGDANWKPGEPVASVSEAYKLRKSGVQRAFEQQGFRNAKLRVSVNRNDVDHTAALVITIDDEGTPTKIDRIEVMGSKRDTPEDVTRYLGVKLGQTVTQSDCAAWYHKLWLSGRYYEQEISLVTPEAPGQQTTLQIRLVDYKPSSPLHSALSPDEQVMLRHREWLVSALERGDALFVTSEWDGRPAEFVAVKGKGTLLFLDALPVRKAMGLGAKQPGGAGAMLIVLTPGEVLHAYDGGKRLLCAPLGRNQITISLEVHPGPSPANAEQGFALVTGLGFDGGNDTDVRAPIGVKVTIAPVAMIGLLQRGNPKITRANGVMTVENDTYKDEIEMATGRLIRLMVKRQEGEAPVTISLEPRSFAECLAAVERKLPPGALRKPNAYDAKRPLSSSLDLLEKSPLLKTAIEACYGKSDEIDQWLADLRIVKKLVARDLLQPFDNYLAEPESVESGNEFWIPNYDKHDSSNYSAMSPIGDELIRGAALAVLYHSDQIFPRDSWPWTLSRGVCLYILDQAQFIEGDLNRLHASTEMGPVGRLITAMLTETFSAEWAARFAKSGMTNIGLNAFRADYRPLLDRNTYAGQFIFHAAEILRDCDDDEAAELGRLLLGNDGYLIGIAAIYLREHKAEPIEKTLPELLDYLWDNGLSKVVARRLTEIYDRNERLARQPERPVPTISPKAAPQTKR